MKELQIRHQHPAATTIRARALQLGVVFYGKPTDYPYGLWMRIWEHIVQLDNSTKLVIPIAGSKIEVTLFRPVVATLTLTEEDNNV